MTATDAPATPWSSAGRELLVGLATVALVAAACMSLGRVFIGVDVVAPVAAALLLSIGGQALARRARLGALAGFVVAALAWAAFVSLAFLSHTLWLGAIPGTQTLLAGVELWQDGIHLIRTRPAPTFAVDPLLIMVVTAVWWVAYAVDLLAVRLRAPLHAVAAAIVLWTVPLALSPAPPEEAWRWALPLLVASAALLLVARDADAPGWSRRVTVGREHASPAGWVTAAVAITAGMLVAGSLPGYGDSAWVEPGRAGPGGGGLTIDNPMMDLRPNLLDRNRSRQPVLIYRSERPVYLRQASMDVFADQRWTNDDIDVGPLTASLEPEAPQAASTEVTLRVEMLNGGAGHQLVPAPYQPASVQSTRRDDLRWDPDTATLAMTGGTELAEGDQYQVTSRIPNPPMAELADADVVDDTALTQLPDSVPEEAAALANDIVDAAGATTPFAQAYAVQEELRRWEYSLEVPGGHDEDAISRFLRERVGYCEQYAGTMAVMLRELGIPARVAVGYGPGDDMGDGEWLVSRGNAHAWVEVGFEDYGWVAFEPTPRDDRNLLTPDTEGGMVPPEIDAVRGGVGAEDGSQLPDPSEPDPGPEEAPDLGEPSDAADDEGDEGRDVGGEGGEDRAVPAVLWWLGGSAGLAVVVTALAVRRRAAGPAEPAEVVVAAIGRLERLARGLGAPRAAVETDAEFVRRIAADHADSEPLIAAAQRARWAVAVPRADADAAARAELEIRAWLLADHSAPARAVVAGRALTDSVAAQLGAVGADVVRWWDLHHLPRPGAAPGAATPDR